MDVRYKPVLKSGHVTLREEHRSLFRTTMFTYILQTCVGLTAEETGRDLESRGDAAETRWISTLLFNFLKIRTGFSGQ